MASKINRLVQTRHLAQAATKQVETQQFVRPENIKSTKLPNGLTISSIENYSPVSRFGVFVRAGARYEPADQLGISHALRLAAGYSTRRSTIFGITRNIEHLGGNLTASTGRENLIYQLHNNRDHNEQTLHYLSDIVTRPAFKQWELEDFQYRFKTELDRLKLDPQAQLIEALHKAAFRGGLSNSLYSPDFNIGSHTSEKLHQYVQQTFQPDRTAIVGSGVDHEKLVQFVEANFEYGAPLSVADQPSKFIAGDVRVLAKGELAFAAVAGEGPSLSNMKDVLAVAALQQLLGIGQRVKHSQGGNKLAIAAGKVAKQPFEVSTIFNQYSDSGLFGIYTVTHGSEAHSVIKAVVSELRNVIKGLTEADVNAAKNILVSSAYQYAENDQNILNKLGECALSNVQLGSHDDLITAIQQLTLKDVTAAGNKLIKGKVAVAAVGQVANVPYAEDLI